MLSHAQMAAAAGSGAKRKLFEPPQPAEPKRMQLRLSNELIQRALSTVAYSYVDICELELILQAFGSAPKHVLDELDSSKWCEGMITPVVIRATGGAVALPTPLWAFAESVHRMCHWPEPLVTGMWTMLISTCGPIGVQMRTRRLDESLRSDDRLIDYMFMNNELRPLLMAHPTAWLHFGLERTSSGAVMCGPLESRHCWVSTLLSRIVTADSDAPWHALMQAPHIMQMLMDDERVYSERGAFAHAHELYCNEDYTRGITEEYPEPKGDYALRAIDLESPAADGHIDSRRFEWLARNLPAARLLHHGQVIPLYPSIYRPRSLLAAAVRWHHASAVTVFLDRMRWDVPLMSFWPYDSVGEMLSKRHADRRTVVSFKKRWKNLALRIYGIREEYAAAAQQKLEDSLPPPICDIVLSYTDLPLEDEKWPPDAEIGDFDSEFEADSTPPLVPGYL